MKRKQMVTKLVVILFILSLVVIAAGFTVEEALALDEYECLTCHGVPDITKENGNGEEISLYVNEEAVFDIQYI